MKIVKFFAVLTTCLLTSVKSFALTPVERHMLDEQMQVYTKAFTAHDFKKIVAFMPKKFLITNAKQINKSDKDLESFKALKTGTLTWVFKESKFDKFNYDIAKAKEIEVKNSMYKFVIYPYTINLRVNGEPTVSNETMVGVK